MKINIKGDDLLKYVMFWGDKTDDECIELATNESGVDAEQALLNIVERDFAVGFNKDFHSFLNKKYNKL